MMNYQISQRFFFEAAHTLNREFDTDASRRVHGHTYHASFSVKGMPDPSTGMVVDVALLRNAAERIKATLDHRLLDDVPGLDFPTLEGLCAYIAENLSALALPASSVEVWREASGDRCILDLERVSERNKRQASAGNAAGTTELRRLEGDQDPDVIS